MKSKLRGGVIGITTLMILCSAVAVIGAAHANIPELGGVSDVGIICGYSEPVLVAVCGDGITGGAVTQPPVQLSGGGGAYTFRGKYYGVSDVDPVKETGNIANEVSCVTGCPLSITDGSYTNVVCETGVATGTARIEGQGMPFEIVFVAGVGVIIPDPSKPIPNSLTETGFGEVMIETGWPIQEIVTGVALITRSVFNNSINPPECIENFDVLAAITLLDVATPIEL